MWQISKATAKRIEFEKENIEFFRQICKKRKNCVKKSVKNFLTKLYQLPYIHNVY